MMATVNQIMSLHPCKEYSRARVKALWAGRPALGVSEIAALPIPVDDRLWILTRLMPHRATIAWACDCVERVLPAWEATHQGDDRPRKAIRVTRAWLRGEATIGEVRDAAYAAIYYAYDAAYAAGSAAFAAAYYYAPPKRVGAAYDAAYDAAYYAAVAVAYAAYHAAPIGRARAAYDTSCDEERAWQLARLVELAEDEEEV